VSNSKNYIDKLSLKQAFIPYEKIVIYFLYK
jgi:hypothetical protein